RRRGGRPVRRHAGRAVEEVRATRRRSPDRSAGDLYGSSARRDGRGADALRRARLVEGSRGNAGRSVAADPRPRRTEARRQREGRPHRAAARERAEEAVEEGARGARGIAEAVARRSAGGVVLVKLAALILVGVGTVVVLVTF